MNSSVHWKSTQHFGRAAFSVNISLSLQSRGHKKHQVQPVPASCSNLREEFNTPQQRESQTNRKLTSSSNGAALWPSLTHRTEIHFSNSGTANNNRALGALKTNSAITGELAAKTADGTQPLGQAAGKDKNPAWLHVPWTDPSTGHYLLSVAVCTRLPLVQAETRHTALSWTVSSQHYHCCN